MRNKMFINLKWLWTTDNWSQSSYNISGASHLWNPTHSHCKIQWRVLSCTDNENLYSSGRIPFAFLEDIHQRFVRTYGRAVHSANAYGMNDEFSRVLSQQMEYYSNDPNADRINRLKGEMSQVIIKKFQGFSLRNLMQQLKAAIFLLALHLV